MSSDVETAQKTVRQLIGQQATVPKPSPAICAIISGLKDLHELQGMAIRTEWRRTASSNSVGESGSPYRFNTGDSPRSQQGHGGKMGFRNGGPDTPIPRVSSTKSVSTENSGGSPPPPVHKYQSKFKNSNQPVEDKILNNIILSKLNKFSPQTYTEIRDFLYQILGSGEPDLHEMVRHFMRLVFKKAAIEEIFCPLYAKLLSEISSRYSVILQEMHNLQTNYIAIFNDIQEAAGTNYDTFVESQKDKQYRRGYSQFLSELTALEILDFDLLNKTFQLILSNMIHFGKQEDKKTLLEEYSDCIFRMAKVLKRKQSAFFVKARSTLWKTNEKDLMDLIDNSGTYVSESAKTKFMLMDVVDILKGI